MTATQSFIARAVLGAGAAGTSLLLVSLRHYLPESKRLFDRAVFGAFALSRLGLYFLLFFVLRVPPRGDVTGYYLHEAEHALAHQLIYRDFPSSYAPLHPYLDGALIYFWHNPLAIILFTILFEILTLPYWFRVARSFLSEDNARIGALLYLASPASLQFVAIDGQNTVLVGGLVGISLYLLLKYRAFLSGVVVGLSIAAVKILPLAFVPVYFFCSLRRWRWSLGTGTILAIIYGSISLLHAPILMPLQGQGSLRSAGDLPYLVEALSGFAVPGRLADGVVLLVLVTIIALTAQAAQTPSPELRMRILNFSMAALMLALILFSKKSSAAYVMLALYPLCLLVTTGTPAVKKRTLILFALFELVMVTEQSFWFTYLATYKAPACHTALLHFEKMTLRFLSLQILFLGGLLWLLLKAVQEVVRTPRLASFVEHAHLGTVPDQLREPDQSNVA